MRRASVLVLLVTGALMASLLGFLVILPLTAPPGQGPQRLLLHNGTVVTMDEDRPRAEAVALEGDRIVAVGTDEEILSLRTGSTLTVDLAGRALLPGFIDSHAHWIGDRERAGWDTPGEAIQAALESGWTSISELFVNQDRLDELRALDASEELRVRVNAYLPLSWQLERFGTWYQAYEPGQEFNSRLRIGGVKLFVDSWLWGETLFAQDELTDLVGEAHRAGFQIASHATRDAPLDMILNAYESTLQGESNERYRHRVEHATMVRDDQIERMRDLGTIASFQLTWFHSDWTESVETELPPGDLGKVGRWRDLLEAGVPAIGSTDYPWVNPREGSVMTAVHQAVTRRGAEGVLPPPWMLDQRITVEQALRLLTIDGAYGTFQENIKGSIAMGKLADLVVLSENPLTIPADRIQDVDVVLTIVGGTAEYCLSYAFLCAESPPPNRVQTLQRMLQDVPRATASRYGGTDDQGQALDTLKIIENPEGGYLGVYHAWIGGTFRVRLATSTDLLRWSFAKTLDVDAHQPTIASLSDGGYLVAFEKDDTEGSHLRFQYYSALASLFEGLPSRTFDAARTLSPWHEGTPNIFSATLGNGIADSRVLAGFHYLDGRAGLDRVGLGVLLNFTTWSAEDQVTYNGELMARGAQGHIGDRDSGTFRGFVYTLQEVVFDPGDWSSELIILHDPLTEAFYTLEIKTHRGSVAFGNPTFTELRSPSGGDAVVVTYFLPHEGAKDGEAGQLIFYTEA